MTAEKKRLIEDRDKKKNWRKFGPYLAERQWGTVREDYSANGEAWQYVIHDHARSKAYRWGEEGIAGISDEHQLLNFSLALWNGKDPILKERIFGLTGKEGNHGEDCKEHYYYLDSTPTHSYMKMLYKYPQQEFPYQKLIEENKKRNRSQLEYDLIDTGIFNDNRYFDVFVEYAKVSPDELLVKVTVHNRGPENAILHLLPHIWFRNTWAWGYDSYKPAMFRDGKGIIKVVDARLGGYYLYAEGDPGILFCENETNTGRLYANHTKGTFKDGINDFIVDGRKSALKKDDRGTKAAVHYKLNISSGGSKEIRLRLSDHLLAHPFADHDEIFDRRLKEADSFYHAMQHHMRSQEEKEIQRQAFAGMLWTKQFYYYDVDQWLKGDPAQPPPPPERHTIRNHDWLHLNNADIISMPDKWEYPWYAAWDLAFHTIPLAMIDPEFAKQQLVLLTKEWYMHPNGQLPAYEWSFSDVNPPVHRWATW
ncbi:MAG: glucosidase, partial [Cyclobacteriaceae bacterium]